MTISWFYSVTAYVLSLLFFLNYSNSLMFWMMMEINLLCFLFILMSYSGFYFKSDSLNYGVYYFLIQSSASILFLSNFSFMEWGSIFNVEDMFLLAMVLKIGLFPLFFWVFKISSSLSSLSLTLLLTLQKIPLFMFLFSSSHILLLLFLILSFVSGSLMVLFSPTLIYMLISSSISYALMFFFFYTYSISLFMTFFLLYSLFLSGVLFLYYNSDCSKFSMLLLFSFFLGLPPFSLFFFKFLFSSVLSLNMGSTELFLFWLFGVVSMIGYFKFFYYSFYQDSSLYLKNKFWFQKMSFFSCTMILFLVLIY